MKQINGRMNTANLIRVLQSRIAKRSLILAQMNKEHEYCVQELRKNNNNFTRAYYLNDLHLIKDEMKSEVIEQRADQRMLVMLRKSIPVQFITKTPGE